MFVNIIKTYRNVVAICDKELLGKKFEEGKFQLDVKENFFRGKEVSEEEALEIMKGMKLEDSTFNIIGKRAVNAALKAEIITKDGVGNIANIPFALVLM
jgi:hypothetical protein